MIDLRDFLSQFVGLFYAIATVGTMLALIVVPLVLISHEAWTRRTP